MTDLNRLEFNGEWWCSFDDSFGENAQSPNEAILKAALKVMEPE